MAVFKVAGPRGYPFKRHVDFLKRHVNFQPYRQELPVRRRADYDAEAAEEVLDAEAEDLVIAAAAFGHPARSPNRPALGN
jgi:hypothetical protein